MATAVERRAIAWSLSACLCAHSIPAALAAEGGLLPRSGAGGQDSLRPHRSFDWSATATVKETITDNVDLLPAEMRRSDWVTELVPSVQFRADGSRVRGALAYQLDYLIYARGARTETRHFLNGSGVLEAVERVLFVDANANISQAVANPFGPRVTNAASHNPNRAEVRSYDVSPYARGQLGAYASYEVRYRHDASQAKQTEVVTSSADVFTAFVNSTARGPYGWRVDASSQTSRSSNVATTHLQGVTGRVRYLATSDLRVEAILGVERTDILSGDYDVTTGYGGAVQYAPSPHATALGIWQHRFFGNAWSTSLVYRLSRMSLNLSDRRDYTIAAARVLATDPATGYARINDALASRIPDPVARAAETQRIIATGAIPPDLNLPLDFVNAGTFLEHRQDASLAWLARRNAVNLAVYRSRRELLRANTGIVDLSRSASGVQDMGGALVLTHQLTPLSTLAGSASRTHTKALDNTGLRSRQWDSRLTFNTRLRPDAVFSLEGRHTQFTSNGTATGIRENALTATLRVTLR